MRALGALGIDEAATRQTLARTVSRGGLTKERVGRRVRWSMTEAARRDSVTGAARIAAFQPARSNWDGRWLLLIASVPEADRGVRHQLRKQLTFVGFGSLGAGLWLSPDVGHEVEAERILARLRVEGRGTSLHSRIGRIGDERRMLREAWNLEELDERYQAFIRTFSSLHPRTDEATFVAETRLIHEWRRFVVTDPGLPEVLLPRRWSGKSAKHLFDECTARWSTAATAWFLRQSQG